MHDYVIVYAKNKESWQRNDLPRTEKQDNAYKNPDNDPRGPWKATPIQARNYYSKGLYKIECPSGRIIDGPPKGTFWRISEKSFKNLDKENRIWWGQNGDNVPAQKRFLTEVKGGIAPSTMWFYDDAGHNAEAKNELRDVIGDVSDDLFVTPKPERLIHRILHIATSPGDLILDSFLGSGTTAAVAHKMGRRWIGIELGEHCYTHCIPRLQKVINGEDPGGITKTVDWKGGGGFRFYELGPSLIKEDRWGNPIINPEFNEAMLAQALCKLEGFTYSPSDEYYWMQGQSTETDFLYVTTQFITADMAEKLSLDVSPKRSLMVCCAAFNCDPDGYENLTFRKIPKAVLKQCQWDHDDYSLAVENLPDAPPEEETSEEGPRNFGKQMDLFGKKQ